MKDSLRHITLCIFGKNLDGRQLLQNGVDIADIEALCSDETVMLIDHRLNERCMRESFHRVLQCLHIGVTKFQEIVFHYFGIDTPSNVKHWTGRKCHSLL